jgi:hypothetical protein
MRLTQDAQLGEGAQRFSLEVAFTAGWRKPFPRSGREGRCTP